MNRKDALLKRQYRNRKFTFDDFLLHMLNTISTIKHTTKIKAGIIFRSIHIQTKKKHTHSGSIYANQFQSLASTNI